MDSKKKIIIISLIFGIVSLALIPFVIYPLFKGIKNNSQELIIVKRELTLSQGRAEKLGQFEKTYKELEPNLEKMDRLFIDPDKPEALIDLIKFWRKTAEDSEVSVNISSVFVKAAETDPWNSLGFQITLTGSSSNFFKFLEKIETSFYLIEIQNLVVRKQSERDVSATLVIKVYAK